MSNDEDVRRTAAFQHTARLVSDNMEHMTREHELIARVAKIKFDAYVKAGFTTDQAVQLVKGTL